MKRFLVRRGMASRLVLAFVLVIGLLAIFSAWSYRDARDERRSASLEETVQVAQTTAALVEGLLRDLDGTTLGIATALGSAGATLDQATVGPVLAATQARYPFVRAFYLMDLDGRVIATPSGQNLGFDLSAQPYTQALRAGQDVVLTDLLPGPQTGTPIIVLARTVRMGEGGVRALLAVAFYPDQLRAIFPGDLPADTNLSIYDRRGWLAYSSAAPELPFAQRDTSGLARVQQAVAGNVVRAPRVVSPVDGKERLAAFVPVRTYGWAVGASQTVAAVEAPLERYYRRQLAALALVTGLSLLLALLLSRALTRPLADLAQAARAVGQGERLPAVPLHGPVEVRTLGQALTQMATEVDAQLTEREHAEARYRGIFEHAVEGIFQTRFDGRFLAVNPAGARLLGYDSPRELMTAVPDVRALYVDASRLADYLQHLQADGVVTGFELQVRRKDGTALWVLLNARAMRDPEGHITLVEGMVSDISLRKEREAMREEVLAREQVARQTAEAANAAKDEFLAMLSHELRTPLTPILGYTTLLARRLGTSDPFTTQALATIERSAKVQERLVSDLLDVSRIITGKLELLEEPTSLVPVVQSALDSVRATAEAKEVQVVAHLPADGGEVRGDAGRLQQVVTNLLTNAVKFTPAGGSVTVRLEQVGNEAVLTVADTGIGIAADVLPHIFDRFRQADSSSTRVHGGLGLGLAIVRSLVERHGGRVAAASAGVGTGATFTVWLPLVVHPPTAVVPGTPPASVEQGQARPLSGVSILVVEDDDDTRAMLRLLLEEYGALVQAARSSQEGLDLVQQSVPDVLVVDIGLPTEDGYAFLTHVHHQFAQGARAAPPPPAIALTAYASAPDRRQALAVGFARHLAKPVQPADLLQALREVLAGHTALT